MPGINKKEFYIIAHNIRSLFNVGSIFRTADAFGVTKIYLTGYTGQPGHYVHGPKIAKSALGAEKFVPWEHQKSATKLIKELKAKNIQIIALENKVKSIKLSEFKPKFPLALVLGEEARGIKKDLLKLCNKTVEIPMHGKKESLNVSVAFGVAAYEISKF